MHNNIVVLSIYGTMIYYDNQLFCVFLQIVHPTVDRKHDYMIAVKSQICIPTPQVYLGL